MRPPVFQTQAAAFPAARLKHFIVLCAAMSDSDDDPKSQLLCDEGEEAGKEVQSSYASCCAIVVHL